MKAIFFGLLTILFLLLVITGGSVFFLEVRAMTGYGLLLHAAVAPVFSVCLAGLAIRYAYPNRFTRQDWHWILKRGGKNSGENNSSPGGWILLRKGCFWLSAGMAVPMILTIVLNMFPLFSMNEQRLLLQIHIYSVVFLSLGMIGFVWFSRYPSPSQ